MIRRVRVADGLFALLTAAALLLLLASAPPEATYTDAYYHANAAHRLADGLGLTDAALWTYLGAPAALTADGTTPAFLYWMPLTALASGASRALGAGTQLPLALAVWGAGLIAYGLALRFTAMRFGAWCAGLLTVSGGFFARFWLQIDTFALYALIGSLCLVVQGEAIRAEIRSHRASYLAWGFSGALAGLAHLTRPDGLVLLLAGLAAAVLVGWRRRHWRWTLAGIGLLLAGYALVMAPWLLRNLQTIGVLLPVGGTASAGFTQYDQLFNYPPSVASGASLADLLAVRLSALFGSGSLLSGNLGTFVAVEGLIALTPFMLIGLWRRRFDAALAPFWLAAIGIHLAMTVVFPLPGARGGLLHASAALFPFWMALGIAGIQDAVAWMAARRKRWNARSATRVFWAAALIFGGLLSVSYLSRPAPHDPYPALSQHIEAGARVVSNDPSAVYYWYGLGGVVVPNAEPGVIPELSRRYAVDYLFLERGGIPVPMLAAWDAPPAFLRLIASADDWKLYAIDA